MEEAKNSILKPQLQAVNVLGKLLTIWPMHAALEINNYRRTSFNCENLILRIASFSRVRKLLIRKLILLIAHPYVQFVQMQLLNSQCN